MVNPSREMFNTKKRGTMEDFNFSQIDIDALSKGDMISAEAVQEIVQSKPSEYEYRLKVLRLRTFLEQYFKKTKGVQITLYQDPRNDLHLLEDSEAYPFLEKQMDRAIVRFKRNANRFYGLDRSNLTNSQARRWEQDCMFISATISSINEVEQVYRTSRPKRDDLGDDFGDGAEEESLG